MRRDSTTSHNNHNNIVSDMCIYMSLRMYRNGNYGTRCNKKPQTNVRMSNGSGHMNVVRNIINSISRGCMTTVLLT